jgi:hypothetical protein
MPRPDLDAPTLNLQRRFAGHVLGLRGSLPNAEAARVPDVQQLNLEVHEGGVVEAGQEVKVREKLPTAPVGALVGRLAMEIRADYNPADNSVTVFLKVPPGVSPEGGQVQLQWPTRTIPAQPPLRLKEKPFVESFDLMESSGAEGEWKKIANMAQLNHEPVALVEFGDAEVPATAFKVENDELYAQAPRFPPHVREARIRVVTRTGRYFRSSSKFTLLTGTAASSRSQPESIAKLPAGGRLEGERAGT